MIDYARLSNELGNKLKDFGNIRKFARFAGVPYASLHDLISGKRMMHTLTLCLLERLLPEASLFFAGASTQNTITQKNVSGDNRVSMAALPPPPPNAALRKIMDCPDIPDAVKVRIYRLLTEEDA